MSNQVNTITLMLVEDDPLARVALKASLEKYDDLKILEETDSGEKAIDLVKEINPDIVIMDIGLQGLDGIETTKKIKSFSPETRILMLTSHDGETQILASFASGADAYCLKDADSKQLHLAIKSIADGNVWLSSQIAEKVLRNLFRKQDKFVTNNGSKKDSSVPLSERELQILKLVVDGKSNQQIAEELFLSLATVKTHVRSILAKLSVDDRTQAAVKAIRDGIVS